MESKLSRAGGATGQPQLMGGSGRFWGTQAEVSREHPDQGTHRHPEDTKLTPDCIPRELPLEVSTLLQSHLETHLGGQAHSHTTAHGDPKPASCSSDVTRMSFLGQGDIMDQMKGWDMLSPRSFTTCDMPQ